jgi:hypothetical protein
LPAAPREAVPAAPQARRGEACSADALPLPLRQRAHSMTKRGRAWAVHDPAGELVALVLYRKGAAEVVRRLDAGAMLAAGENQAQHARGPQ